MSKQRESKLSKDIIDALRIEGCFAFKVHGSEYMMVGLPDIIVCVDGMFVGLETKNPGQERQFKKAQALRQSQIRTAGGVAELVTSVDQALQIIRGVRHDQASR